MNSTNWPAPNVLVFIDQLVEQCSANAEVMGSNPGFFLGGGVGGWVGANLLLLKVARPGIFFFYILFTFGRHT